MIRPVHVTAEQKRRIADLIPGDHSSKEWNIRRLRVETSFVSWQNRNGPVKRVQNGANYQDIGDDSRASNVADLIDTIQTSLVASLRVEAGDINEALPGCFVMALVDLLEQHRWHP